MAINIPNVLAKAMNKTGNFTQVYFRLFSDLVTFVNNQPVTLDYAGSPEGNVAGRYKDQCWDTVNSKLYFKGSGSGDTGWVILN